MKVKILINAFVVIVVVIIAISGGVFLGRYLGPEPPSSTTIVDQIKKVSELATVAYHVTVVEEDDPKPEGVLYEKVKILLIWPGWVKAGIDLKKAGFQLNDDKSVLTVSLPPVEILSAEPDDDGFKFYIIKNYGTGLGKPPSATLVAKWAGKHAKKLKDDALKLKIEDLALVEAKNTIEALASSFGISVKYSP